MQKCAQKWVNSGALRVNTTYINSFQCIVDINFSLVPHVVDFVQHDPFCALLRTVGLLCVLFTCCF